MQRNDVERGNAICTDTRTGQLVRGPESTGTRNRVEIILACPPGSRLSGIFHTHPGGVALPSSIDANTAKQTPGVEQTCIQVPGGELRCFAVRRPSVGHL